MFSREPPASISGLFLIIWNSINSSSLEVEDFDWDSKHHEEEETKAIRTATETPTIPGPKPREASKYSFTVPSNPAPTILVSTSPSWEEIIPRSVHETGQM